MRPIDLWHYWQRTANDAARHNDRIREAFALGCVHTLERVYPGTLGRTPRLPEGAQYA